MVIFPIRRSSRIQKSKKKKRKIFYGMFSLAVFLFPVIKRAEKVSGFVSVSAEGKYEINYKKKRIFFSPLVYFFTIFGRQFAGKEV